MSDKFFPASSLAPFSSFSLNTTREERKILTFQCTEHLSSVERRNWKLNHYWCWFFRVNALCCIVKHFSGLKTWFLHFPMTIWSCNSRIRIKYQDLGDRCFLGKKGWCSLSREWEVVKDELSNDKLITSSVSNSIIPLKKISIQGDLFSG